MAKVKVQLLQLGNPPVDLRKVAGWSSEQFEFTDAILHNAELPNSDGEFWTLSKKALTKLIGKPKTDADIVLAVTDRPIELNYYMHRLTDTTCILSLYEVSAILALENLQPEMFVVRNVYELVCIWQEFGGKIRNDAYTVHHEDTRGCLYDLNADKRDVVRSTAKVCLCASCKARLVGKALPLGFVGGIEQEIRRIRKQWAFKVLDFVKAHPVWSLVISSVWAWLIGLASNLAYGWLRK